MKPLVVLVALAGAARADSLFASDHAGTLVVSRLAGDTLTTAYEEPDSGVLEYDFTDAHTLWALRAQKGVFTIEKIVDGKPGNVRVLKYADWKPAEGKPAVNVPNLYVTAAGQVWVGRCVVTVHDEETKTDRNGCPPRYLRIDADAEVADKPPKGLRNGNELDNPHDEPSKRGPKGYTFAVTPNGFTCTGPKHRLVFPAGTRSVDFVFWLTSDPAIVHFSVNDYNDDEQASPADGIGDFLLEDCNTYLNAVKTVEPGVVATTEGKGAWKLRRGTKLLGTFTAAHVAVAPL